MQSIYLQRKRNSTTRGGSFSATTIQLVWEKGQAVPGHNSDIWRKDVCGAWMKRTEYGNTNSQHGWEIDHKKPVAAGGGDELSNLQPLHWENNRYKSDGYPEWGCKIRSN